MNSPIEQRLIKPFQGVRVMMGINQVVTAFMWRSESRASSPASFIQDGDSRRGAQHSAEHLGGVQILLQAAAWYPRH